MIVRRLELDFYRNYPHLEADFSPVTNVIYGENAQGKTNLLEALAYLSTASSHRARYDRELIQFGVDSAFIKGELFSRERDFTLEARLSRTGRKHLFSNGVRLKNAGELSGILNTVLFCPEDLSLIREGAAARRRFLNECICQLRPRYAATLAEYNRLHEHKTRILRDWPEKPSLLDTLDEFSLRMAQTGAILIHYRAHFVKRLRETAPSTGEGIVQAFTSDDHSGKAACKAALQERLGLTYETVRTVTDPEASPRDILPRLLEHQEAHRQAELEARSCLTGPHKDDLNVELDGRSAKSFASQGQTRTAALSLKLAAREIFFHDTGEWPVLLLDDVLSELDARRQEFVLNRIQGGQVFITCCEDDKLEGLREGKTFHIRAGALI